MLVLKQQNGLLVTSAIASLFLFSISAAVSETRSWAKDTAKDMDKSKNQKISIVLGKKKLSAKLVDSKASRDFVSLLPLTLTLSDYAVTEKISDLPKKLSTEGSPPGYDPSIGDIAYYAPWGNLAIFYKDSGYANGLIKIGKIESGEEAFNVPGSLKVTIELTGTSTKKP